LIYVIVPSELADELHEPLREHFAGSRGVEVLVDRRGEPGGPVYLGVERRSARQLRRRLELPALPAGHAERLSYLELSEPADLTAADEQGLRLVTRFQSGEVAAFDHLYARYFASVYSYLSGALGDPHEAEDLSQETWVRVQRALARFEIRPGVPFRRWLFRTPSACCSMSFAAAPASSLSR
jgi:hypothetical protein